MNQPPRHFATAAHSRLADLVLSVNRTGCSHGAGGGAAVARVGSRRRGRRHPRRGGRSAAQSFRRAPRSRDTRRNSGVCPQEGCASQPTQRRRGVRGRDSQESHREDFAKRTHKERLSRSRRELTRRSSFREAFHSQVQKVQKEVYKWGSENWQPNHLSSE